MRLCVEQLHSFSARGCATDTNARVSVLLLYCMFLHIVLCVLSSATNSRAAVCPGEDAHKVRHGIAVEASCLQDPFGTVRNPAEGRC